jgi:hypothetical protein
MSEDLLALFRQDVEAFSAENFHPISLPFRPRNRAANRLDITATNKSRSLIGR